MTEITREYFLSDFNHLRHRHDCRMLASSSSDEELDDRQQPPPSAPTTSIAGCGGGGSVGRGHRDVGSRPAPGAHSTASGQTTRKPQSPLQQSQHCQPNGARCSQTRHQIFSSTSSRSSVRSNDTCDNAKHRRMAVRRHREIRGSIHILSFKGCKFSVADFDAL
ncbi:hypothetical protein TSMEX_004027 [Taenia solium]|eukprot:TsM_000703800 transcript=TsM_000703800 gene=TsM_000703800